MSEKMLVTQALDERDLLVKKISDKIDKASFVDTIKPNEDKVYSKRFVPFLSRSPEETKKIKVLAGCLNYFKEYVANQDMLDFSSLLKTNATYEEIHKAFNWICSRANIDINEYIKNIERKGGIK